MLTPEQTRLAKRIARFTSSDGMCVPELGIKTVSKLVETGIIKRMTDFFSLHPNVLYIAAYIEDIDKARRVCEIIDNGKVMSLSNFIYCLDIPFVAEHTSTYLAGTFIDADALANATLKQLEAVPEIGSEKSAYIHSWLEDGGRQYIEHLTSPWFDGGCGLKISSDYKLTFRKNIKDKRIYINGKFSGRSPKCVQTLIKACGGRVVLRVTENTSAMLVGDIAATVDHRAVAHATALNIPIMPSNFLTELQKIV